MATHSSILAWKISWTEEPGGLQLDTTEQLNMHARTWLCCREWQATVHRIAKSWAQLKPWSMHTHTWDFLVVTCGVFSCGLWDLVP